MTITDTELPYAPVDPEALKDALRAAMTENPDRLNPVEYPGGQCVYNGILGGGMWEGQDTDEVIHCVAGTAFINLGADWQCFEERINASELGRHLGLIKSEDYALQDLVDNVQKVADGNAAGDHVAIHAPSGETFQGVPRTWGETLKICREQGWL